MCGHPQPAGSLARAEYLDQLTPPDRAASGQVLGRDVAASRVQGRQPVQVDHLIGDLEPGIGEALELRQPAMQRHLAALEGRRNGRTGLAALGATTSRLALGTFTTANPGSLGVRTWRWAQMMNLQA